MSRASKKLPRQVPHRPLKHRYSELPTQKRIEEIGARNAPLLTYWEVAGRLSDPHNHIGLLLEKDPNEPWMWKLMYRHGHTDVIDSGHKFCHGQLRYYYPEQYPNYVQTAMEEHNREMRLHQWAINGTMGYNAQKQADTQERWERYDRADRWYHERKHEMELYYQERWLNEARQALIPEYLERARIAAASGTENRPKLTFGPQLDLFLCDSISLPCT